MSKRLPPTVWRISDIASGAPLMAGTGVLVEFVAGLFAAGESVSMIAEDYGVPHSAVEDAIRSVVKCRGTNLWEKRARRNVERFVPEYGRKRDDLVLLPPTKREPAP